MSCPSNQSNLRSARASSSSGAAFQATKILQGGTLQDGQFAFAVFDCNGNQVAAATNDASGNVNFPDLQLTTPGIYKYTISETPPAFSNFVIDTTVFPAQVIVRDDGSTEISYPNGAPVFTNTALNTTDPPDTTDPPVGDAGSGNIFIDIESLRIDTVNISGCGCGNISGGDDGDGGLEGAMPQVPTAPQKVCTGSQNTPSPTATNFTVPTEGWILCHESPQYYEFDTLTIAPGGFIRAVCTALTLKANTLVIQDALPPQAALAGRAANANHIEILGDYGDPGDPGAPGSQGTTGSKGAGTKCNGAVEHHAHDGDPGGTGSSGGVGGVGRPGQANLPASFYFGDIQSRGPVVIFTQSGGGGVGGKGGKGGKGGIGGEGGDTKKCAASCTQSAGDGGPGGEGGPGGDGGQGGQGTNGQDVYVYVKTGQESKITHFSALAPAGSGGDPGDGGDPGQGGAGGKVGCFSHIPDDGRPGSDGKTGAPGKPGAVGTVQGAAGNIYVSASDDPLNPQRAQFNQATWALAPQAQTPTLYPQYAQGAAGTFAQQNSNAALYPQYTQRFNAVGAIAQQDANPSLNQQRAQQTSHAALNQQRVQNYNAAGATRAQQISNAALNQQRAQSNQPTGALAQQIAKAALKQQRAQNRRTF